MYSYNTIKRADPEPDPTPAQRQAGNYKKDHITFGGLNIAIENLKGSTRKGIDEDGEEWSSVLPEDYGYIKGTVGADGQHVDCYVGNSDKSTTVWVVNQKNLKTDEFDEHKCFIGFDSKQDAIVTYVKGFSDGKGLNRIMDVKEFNIEDFKSWLNGDTTKAANDYEDNIPIEAYDNLEDDVRNEMLYNDILRLLTSRQRKESAADRRRKNRERILTTIREQQKMY